MPKRTHRKIRAGDRLKICIISEYYYPTLGGITEHVYNFARNMIRMGHQVTLLTSNAGDSKGRGDLQGLNIVRVGRSTEIYSNGSIARMTIGWRLHREVEEFFKQNSFDIVHIHSPLTPTLPLLCMKYITSPVVGTFHTDFRKSAALSFWRKKAQVIIDNTDGLVAVSPISIRSICRYMEGEARFKLIPNGVDTEWFYPRKERLPKLDDGRPNILYIGRFDPRNGFSTMIDAFEIVKKSVKDARMVVIGYGPLQSYYLSRIPAELREDIIFVGKSDIERPHYYASSDVICVPAKQAACSVAILEALATATPIVASDIDGFKWITKHEKEAMLVPVLDPNAYAQAMIKVLENRELKSRLQEKGLQKAMGLDWKLISADVLDLYYELLDSREAIEAAFQADISGEEEGIRALAAGEISLQLS
ncbi:MAG: glycosyltransferase family 4 protein [Pseudomonadota bacterium]